MEDYESHNMKLEQPQEFIQPEQFEELKRHENSEEPTYLEQPSSSVQQSTCEISDDGYQGIDSHVPEVDEADKFTFKKTANFESLDDLDKTIEVDEDIGEICELHVYERRYNSKGEEVTLQVGATEELEVEDLRSPDAALVLTRYYDEDKDLDFSLLEVRSSYMKKAMADVIGDYPGVSLGTSKIYRLYDKPKCLFHYREELKAYGQASNDGDMREHVAYLLKYMEKVFQKEIASYETQMIDNTDEPGLKCSDLWMAFRPGDLLYHTEDGECQVSRLKNVRERYDSDHRKDCWILDCENIKCDGQNFVYTLHSMEIRPYEGCKSLSKLKAMPLRLHKDIDSIRKTLVMRGNIFRSLLGVNFRFYRGTARFLKDAGRYETFEATGRIVIDSEEFVRNIDAAYLDYSRKVLGTNDKHTELGDEDVLICSHEIPAFSLQHRQWGLFKVSGLEEIEFDHGAFDALVLPQNYKELLLALINTHRDSLSEFDDVVRGKGKGLIFLLHGEPGVGKTLTAESISELTGRPLYTIGAGDLYLDGASVIVERELSRTLKLAAKWNALVLLDEADVFMAERGGSHYSNELVSVLLRTVEYFEGIMFMTTNRFLSIDTAFASRIHLILAYPELDASARRRIWTTFISSISNSASPEWLDDDFLDKVASYKINGRQVKNVTRIACAIAANNGRELAADDIMKGLEAVDKSLEDMNKRPRGASLRDHYKRELSWWFRNFPRRFLFFFPSGYVMGPLLALGMSSALHHGFRLGMAAYYRLRR